MTGRHRLDLSDLLVWLPALYVGVTLAALFIPGRYMGIVTLSQRTVEIPLLFAVGLAAASLPLRGRPLIKAPIDPSPFYLRASLALESLGVVAATVRLVRFGVPLVSGVERARLALVAWDPPLWMALGIVLLQVAPSLALCSGLAETERRRPRFRAALALTLLSASILLLLGNRVRLVALLAGLAITALLAGARLPRKLLASLGTGGVAFLGIFQYFRYRDAKTSAGVAAYLDKIGLHLPAWLAWVGLALLPFRGSLAVTQWLVQTFPSMMPHTHGWFVFGELLALLPGKQELPENFVTEVIMKSNVSTIGSTATPFPAALYVDWGLLGVLVGGFLAGLMLQGLILAAKGKGNPALIVAAATWAFSLGVGVYGNLPFSILNVWQIALLLALAAVASRLERTPSHGSP